MEKIKVLFVCVHNSARSRMAEAFLNALGGGNYIAESAGLEPGEPNPIAVEAMKEAGFDISAKKTQSVFELFKAGRHYNYVITVCDDARAQRCPVFPGYARRLHWSIPDPLALQGSHDEKLMETRNIRDQIITRIREWLSSEK